MKSLGLLLVSLLLVLGCSRGPESGSAKVSGSATPSAIGVAFVPSSPTCTEDLRISVTGAGERIICEWTVNGTPAKGLDGAILPKESYRKGDRIAVRVTSGAREGTASALVGNAPPRVTAVHFSPRSFHRGIDLSIVPDTFDPDGDSVQFRTRWYVNGEEVSSADIATLPGSRFRRGDRIALTVVPYDSEGEGEPFRSAELLVPNAPPSFVSPPPGPFRAETFRYQARASDPDDDALLYSLEKGAPGMQIDPHSGSLLWSITPKDYGKHSVKIVAQDPHGGVAFLEFTLDIDLR